MLVKYVSETRIERFKGYIEKDHKIYTNAEAEKIALAEGWKPLVVDDQPIYDLETQYLSIFYINEEDKVRQSWIVNNIEES